MKVTLPELERTGVMVVGDVMLGRYRYGPTSRISPEASVPVVKVNTIGERPGGVANVVMSIASLDVNARLVGLTSTDDATRALSKSLADVNAKCDFISVPTHPTITKLRVLSRGQQLIRLNFEGGFEGVGPQLLREWINQVLGSIDALVLSDYAKSALTSVQQMTQLAREADVPMLIGPKDTDFKRHCGATLLTPNLSEFEAVIGKCKTEEEVVERGMKLTVDYELSVLSVTRSEQDMSLLQLDKAPLHMPTQAQEIYDTTSTGDTVIGTLAATLAAGNPLEEARFFASTTAGVVIGRLGTSTVSPIELENAVRGYVSTGFGVTIEEEPELTVAAARERNEKVVMTNSVFDILHAGHVSYLANARKLGDRLIVAVNNDASTEWLREDSRLVNPLEQRMIVLGVLEAVDRVVSSEKDISQCLVAGVLSDLLVKNSDCKSEEVTGSREVRANGGKVLVLNFEGGCSTTNIIKKIQQDREG